MRRTRRHWSMTVQKMRDTHCERRKHQTYCNRSENLHVCPACGCRLSSLADRSYYFVHDFLLMLDRFLYAPLGLGEIVSLIGRSSGSGIKYPMNWGSALEESFSSCVHSLFSRANDFRDFGLG